VTGRCSRLRSRGSECRRGTGSDTGTTIPAYVRPTSTLTHYEFLLRVTPEMFRGIAVHPYGVPVLSIGRPRHRERHSRLGEAAQGSQPRDGKWKEALAAVEGSRRKPPDR